MKVKGSVAVVTGAASGIGKALSEKLRDAGALAVVVSDIDGSGVEKVAAELGDVAVAVETDVAHEASVRALASVAMEQFGRIDLFCSNAGITVTGGYEAPDADWRRAMDVNLMAHVYAARAVLPSMLEAGRGHLLQTLSAAGVLTAFGAAPYTVSKHAAVAFAEYLAVHYGSQGVGVSCLCPQAVNTPTLTASVNHDESLAVLKSISEVLEPGQVANTAVAGIEANQLYIFPHSDTADSYRRRADNPDHWAAEMRALLADTST
jgi:NAD(P)-dependent dehydrogenase (short-subunit alcohol dehydrogenase family)